MIQITVTDEQARLIAEASAPVVLVDSQGRPLGQVSTLDSKTATNTSNERNEAEVADVARRMQTPGNYVPLSQIKESLGWQDQT